MKIIPTILCGGAGSRLWPVSRALFPKPFIRLNDHQSFLQKAFLRAACLPSVEQLITVTNKELFFKVRDDYQEVNQNQLKTDYILEPFGRNTAAAIAAAAIMTVRQHGDDAIMVVLAADHLIENETAFQEAVFRASLLASQGNIVTFGIQPESAETGYGYIEVNAEAPIFFEDKSSRPIGFHVKRFVEKPDLDTAITYVESGHYLWNSGMFCFKASVLLEQMAEMCPQVLTSTLACLEASSIEQRIEGQQLHLEPTAFHLVPDISFDYALMEPMSIASPNKTAVVPCAIGWSDIGSWKAMGELIQPDTMGNRVVGEAILQDSENCDIHGQGRLVGAVGLDNLIIVDTPDALLVADKNRAQDVKHIYESLKGQNHDVHKLHRTVHRPWGTYTVLEEGERFKIKRIEVKPGERLSLQMHHHRSEHWIVVQGTAKVTNGDRELLVRINESTYIPAGHAHRLENPGIVPLVLIEVQSGEYLGEDDIVRFEDNYGRVEINLT